MTVWFKGVGVRVLIMVSAGGLIVLLAGCGSISSPRGELGSTECPSFGTDAVAAVAALEHDYGDTPGWGGAEVVEHRDEVIIHYVGMPPECLSSQYLAKKRVTSKPQSSQPNLTIRIAKATYTLDHLEKLTSRLAKDQDQLARENIRLADWGPDIRLNRVVVHLEASSDKARGALHRRYSNAVRLGGDRQDEGSSEGSRLRVG